MQSVSFSTQRVAAPAMAVRPAARVVPAARAVAAPARAARRVSKTAAQAVKFEYDTKVFPRELVKFANTEEYIYRCVRIARAAPRRPLPSALHAAFCARRRLWWTVGACLGCPVRAIVAATSACVPTARVAAT